MTSACCVKCWLLIKSTESVSECIVCTVERTMVSVCSCVQWESLCLSQGDAFIKFEPFVLHVQCARLTDAQLLVRTSVISVPKINSILIPFSVLSLTIISVPILT